MQRGHNIELDDQLHERLRNYAQANGVDEENVLREAIQEFLASRENGSLLDAFQADGLIGCLPGTPPDLSSNEEHFEGFGHG